MRNFTDNVRDTSLPIVMAFSVLSGSGNVVAQTLNPRQIAEIRTSVVERNVCQSDLPVTVMDQSDSITVTCAEKVNMFLSNMMHSLALAAQTKGSVPKIVHFSQAQPSGGWQQTELQTSKLRELTEQLIKKGLRPENIMVKYDNKPNFAILVTPGQPHKILLTTQFISDTPAKQIADTVNKTIEKNHNPPQQRSGIST